jgi:hypothetical protein
LKYLTTAASSTKKGTSRSWHSLSRISMSITVWCNSVFRISYQGQSVPFSITTHTCVLRSTSTNNLRHVRKFSFNSIQKMLPRKYWSMWFIYFLLWAIKWALNYKRLRKDFAVFSDKFP